MLSVACILLIAALIVTLLNAVGRAPLWVAVLLLNIAALLGCLPLR